MMVLARTPQTRTSRTRRAREAARAALILLAAAAVAVPGARAQDGGVVARSGSTTLSESAVRALIELEDARTRETLLQDPVLLGQFVRGRLARMAILAEAKGRKWDQNPDVQRRIEQARADVIIDSYIASKSQPPDEYPSEAEIEAAYEANKSRFLTPRRYRLAQIFIALPAGADREVQDATAKRVRELAQQAQSGKTDFADLARRHSDEKLSAANGGEMDWLSEDRLLPQVRDAVAGLAKGDVSEPVRAPDGWHVLRRLETEPASAAPLSTVRTQIAEALRQQKANDTANAFVVEFLRQNPVQIDEIKLSKLTQK
jgi:parvulin-like peptidyl-prolyl isomerase